MGMTMTQKILASHAGLNEVKAGQLVEASVDLILGNDVTAPVAINEFRKLGAGHVFDKSKVAIVPDHFTPNKDIKSAENSKLLREFAAEQEIVNYFEVGRMGIEHCLIPEKGLAAPGELIVGADSHTCTYGALGAFSTGVGSTDMACAMATGKLWFRVPRAVKFALTGMPGPFIGGKDVILHIIGKIGVDGALYQSMEFVGEGLKYLGIDDRFTIANMAIEAGGKNGVFPADDIALEYAKARVNREYTIYEADADAEYTDIIEINLSELRPAVSFPHLPENTKNVDEAEGVEIDQVVIGSCTNGRISDLRIAAGIMKGKKAHPRLRVIVLPGTQEIYLQAVREGLAEIFVEAGAVFSTPTCGPCLGGYMGILAKGERALSTTNRNFVGRMGHPESEVYLCGPAVAAASALTGKITGPEAVISAE
ncbi:MAG: 3-isopropylmalate dehydratase large subunit [Clostridiales bacterium]|jgi:3-isopropylmalate/(R)-2-methylmalate dehydratase large subunit|nr:3-isopropylmalate dehydratase large subunit [Clostridiales bacterium]